MLRIDLTSLVIHQIGQLKKVDLSVVACYEAFLNDIDILALFRIMDPVVTRFKID